MNGILFCSVNYTLFRFAYDGVKAGLLFFLAENQAAVGMV